MKYYDTIDNNHMILELLEAPEDEKLQNEFLSITFPEDLTKIMREYRVAFFGGLDRLALRTLKIGLTTIAKSCLLPTNVCDHAATALKTSGLSQYEEKDFAPASRLNPYRRY